LSIIILLGGCFVNSNKGAYDEDTVDKIETKAESFINNNFKDVNKIEFEEPHESPMGSMVINANVNDIGISLTFNNDFTISSYSKEKGFPEKKDECKDKVCDY